MSKIIKIAVFILLISACKHESLIKTPIDNSCETNTFAFNADVKPLLDSECVFCHQTGSNTGVALQTYDEVKFSVDSNNLLGSIIHDGVASPMPQGEAKWDSCKINILSKWINDGAPNN